MQHVQRGWRKIVRCLAIGAVAYPACVAAAPNSGAVAGATDPVHAAAAMPLAAHRAVYDVTLLRATGSKSPTSARGRVSYEFGGNACEGYSQTFRQVTQLQPAEGATRLSDLQSATFEGPAGKSFSFNIKTSSDGGVPDVVDGHAEKNKGDVLAIKLSKPNEQVITVDQDVLFPTAHLERIIATAKAGRNMLDAKVFDGSDDGKKVYETTTIIGHRIIGPTDDGGGAARTSVLDGMPRWPITISYFENGRRDQEPAYTLGFELYENGVSRALRFDYGDFVLAARMTKFELLPSGSCNR